MLVAIDDHHAIDESRSSGQKAGCSPGIAKEKRLFGWQELAGSGDDERGIVRLGNIHAHGAQGVGHVAGIIALQRTRQAARALGKTRQQQRPVGDRLRAGRTDAPFKRMAGRKNGQFLVCGVHALVSSCLQHRLSTAVHTCR